MQSTLFFAYKNVTKIALFFCILKCFPLSAYFKISMKNCVTHSVQIFVYKDVNCLAFAKCIDFLYKPSRNAKFHAILNYVVAKAEPQT